jgi:hypothetical protein
MKAINAVRTAGSLARRSSRGSMRKGIVYEAVTKGIP